MVNKDEYIKQPKVVTMLPDTLASSRQETPKITAISAGPSQTLGGGEVQAPSVKEYPDHCLPI